MKILVLSKDDWANSGNKIKDSINSVLPNTCECFTINNSGFSFGRKLLREQDKRYVQSWINQAEVVIYKGDDGVINPFGSYLIPESKPKVVIFCGGKFLRDHETIVHMLPKSVKRIVVLRPDFLFRKDFIYIAHPVDCNFWKPVIRNNVKLVVGHSVSNHDQRKLKGSDVIEGVVKNTSNLAYLYIYKKPFNEAKRLKELCDIYIESIGFRYYGNNGAEACALGIPTIVEVPKKTLDMAGENLVGLGIINADKGSLRHELELLARDEVYRIKMGVKARNWALKTHDYRVVGMKFIQLCKEVR